jgi:ADP-heptose:LPS heptosyltransferase
LIRSLQALRRFANFAWWLIVLRPLDLLIRAVTKGAGGDRVLIAYPARIGDSVLWLNAAKGVRRLYPASRWNITLLADPAFAELARLQPEFDAVWEFDRDAYFGNLRYRIGLDRRVAAAGFRIVLNPAVWADQYHVDSLVGMNKAAVRVGWDIKQNGASWAVSRMRRWRARQYNKMLPQPAGQLSMLRRNEAFVRALGATSFKYEAPSLITGGPEFSEFSSSSFYILCPGAAEPLKRWPSESFARLADAVTSASGMVGVVCGTKAERDLASRVCALAETSLVNMAGKLSVSQLASLFKRASMVIANDSGPVHMAAALGVPSVCILGGGTFGWCMPYDVPYGKNLPKAVWHPMDCYQCEWHCVFHPSPGDSAPCLVRVPVERVASEVLGLLSPGRINYASGSAGP